MSISLIREFIVLADAASYHLAAKQLFVSQSSLSKHIFSMEKELYVRLFNRRKMRFNSASLTEAGKVFYQKARLILSMYDSVAHELLLYQVKS